MRPVVCAIALLLPVLFVAGCSSTRIASSWSDPGRPAKSYRTLLVFGVAAKEKIRSAYEDSFVTALKDRGVQARAGSDLLPSGSLRDVDAVQRAVARSGADGVVVTHLVGETARTVLVPLRSYTDPQLYGRLYPYYGSVYDTVTQPGYYARYPVLQLETNLYDARRETLVWSGRSETMDPGSDGTTIAEVIGAVIQALAEAGHLPD
jgi:hypothetical protein